MEESMYITNIMRIIKKFLWLIILIAVIGGVAGKFMASSGAAPTYEASSLVLVEKQTKQPNIIINQSDENTRFLNTAQSFIDTSAVLGPVIKDLNLNMNTKDLSGAVTVTNENSSQMLRITVSNSNAKLATKIANKTADVFVKKVGSYLDVSKVEIIEKAQSGQENLVLHTRSKANIAMGVIIGGVLGVILAFILASFTKGTRPSK